MNEQEYNEATSCLSSLGQDWFYNMRDERRAQARRIREFRAECAKLPLPRHLRQQLACQFANNLPELPRITRRALLKAAQREALFAASPLPGAPGCGGTYEADDGYSFCGLADAHSEDREESRRYAMLLLAAATWAHR